MIDFRQTLAPRGQRGSGKLGALVAIVVVVFVIYVLVKYVPMKIQKAELADFAKRQATEVAIGRINERKLVENLMQEASGLGVQLNEGDVEVDVLADRVNVDFTYRVALKMVWGDWEHVIDVHADAAKL